MKTTHQKPIPSPTAEELVAPCGINCARCSGYLALRHDLKNKGVRMSYCRGCRPRDKRCAFLKKQCQYLLEKKVEYCFQCPTYPCRNLQHIDQRYQNNFHLSFLGNLHTIQTQGVKKFLQHEHKKWKCPTCSEMICCHNGLCFSCNLATLKAKKNIYRWEDG